MCGVVVYMDNLEEKLSERTADTILFGSGDPGGSEPENLSCFINTIPGGIIQCLFDEHFTILKVNRGLLQLLGYSQAEFIRRFKKRYAELILPEDREKVLSEVGRQIRETGSYEVEYRMCRKDGKILRILDRGGLCRQENSQTILCCEIADITMLHETNEALRLSSERHQIIMDLVTDAIFEWDFGQRQLQYSSDRWKQFGIRMQQNDSYTLEALLRNVHPKDRKFFLALSAGIREAETCVVKEFRLIDSSGKEIWCRLKITFQYDAAGNPLKAIGLISNIDKEHRMIEQLKEKAEKDPLTGLYDKIAVGSLVEKYLSDCPQTKSALVMLDIDNFKRLNDTMGHMFGDAILSEFAAAMKKELTASDIIGRVGGDEFSVFMKNIESREQVEKKAERLLDILQNRLGDKKDLFEISCSIGIAFSPEHGKVYSDLYEHADIALYDVKNSGKNKFAVYNENMNLKYISGDLLPLGAKIDSDLQQAGTADRLTEYVLHTLYTNENVEEALQLILEIVGRQFDVSRAYIFENSEDGSTTCNTFEWCNDGITPEKANLQNLSYNALDHYEDRFRENNIFYCRNIDDLTPPQKELLGKQGIRSILQCKIMQNGKFYGFVGFDECTGLRFWNQQEIKALTLLSELIGTFLLKKRAQDKDRRDSQKMKALLDLQDSYIYMVDKKTYKILYLNKSTIKLDSRAQIGMPCYQVFFGNSKPCERCPISICAESAASLEIYNPQYGVWTSVKAAPMQWDGLDAYLIVCNDITKYTEQPPETFHI